MHHLEICSEICVRSILVTGRAAHVPVTNPSSCLLKVVTGLRSLVKQDKLKELDSKIKVLIGKHVVDF